MSTFQPLPKQVLQAHLGHGKDFFLLTIQKSRKGLWQQQQTTTTKKEKKNDYDGVKARNKIGFQSPSLTRVSGDQYSILIT